MISSCQHPDGHPHGSEYFWSQFEKKTFCEVKTQEHQILHKNHLPSII